MKKYFYFLLLLFTNQVFAQYQGPIPALTSGYGSEGPLTVSVENIANDYFALKDISVFYPTGQFLPFVFYMGTGGMIRSTILRP